MDANRKCKIVRADNNGNFDNDTVGNEIMNATNDSSIITNRNMH